MYVQGFGKMFQAEDERLPSIPTSEVFSQIVQRLVDRYRLSYFDAIRELCDYHDREYESVRPLLTPKLKLILLEEMSKARAMKDNSFFDNQLG